ncbi:hypothetical protein F2Q69_00013624 [Brassica cretica]|uniref:Uncharacterized protein n=1 Tax=Brassica cretica TaxID=69181 RepID=A0A8S9QR38_BRACR|nr:hypothetical protein F2Q69_00013624 [Brassica cretica]
MGEEIDALKAATKTFKFEMVMAVNGARVVARWENKGVLPPTFEDEPAIPLVSEMDVDLSVKPRGSPT